jgi:hypothetical protein
MLHKTVEGSHFIPGTPSIRADFGLVSLFAACIWLIQDFVTYAESPRDKREESCSRNDGLGIGIWAYSGAKK